jgi:hypothetical protein
LIILVSNNQIGLHEICRNPHYIRSAVLLRRFGRLREDRLRNEQQRQQKNYERVHLISKTSLEP